MDARRKVKLIFRFSFYLIGGFVIFLILNLMSPNDKSFSSINDVSEYFKENYNQSIIRTLDIDNFKFIVIESEDRTYYSSRILYSKKENFYLFEASSKDVVCNNGIFGIGSIEVYRIDGYFVVSVGTGEYDIDGNPIEVSSSDNVSFSILKITDNSLNYYKVYDKLPKSFVIKINEKSYSIN